MENKFKVYERNIQQTIKNEIRNNQNNQDNTLNQDNKLNKSFASIVKSNQDTLLPQFRKLLHDEKIQEVEEERQKEVRRTNLIIFGVKESEELSNNDETFIRNLVKDIGASSTVTFMTRIGSKRTNYTRPIKVVFGSAHEAYLIIKNLIKLKDNPKYRGISITGDFTLFERSVMKEWSNKAKERNA